MIGPVGAGKSCLAVALLFGFLSDSRFTYTVDTFLQMAAMYRSLREGQTLCASVSTESFLLAISDTSSSTSACALHVYQGGWFTGQYVYDEDREDCPRIESKDLVLFVVDASEVLEGIGRVSTGCSVRHDNYKGYLTWHDRANAAGATIVTVVTKSDLVSELCLATSVRLYFATYCHRRLTHLPQASSDTKATTLFLTYVA